MSIPDATRNSGAPTPGWRRRMRRPWVPLGLLVLLFVLIAVVPRQGLRSHSLPPGRFGAAIRCLERNDSFRVTAFGTDVAPERADRTIVVQSNLGHHTLAELRDTGSPAAARSVVRANRFGELERADYRLAGPIVWGYARSGSPLRYTANAGERALVASCVRRPGG